MASNIGFSVALFAIAAVLAFGGYRSLKADPFVDAPPAEVPWFFAAVVFGASVTFAIKAFT